MILEASELDDFNKIFYVKRKTPGNNPEQSLAGLITIHGKERFYIDNDTVVFTNNNTIQSMNKKQFGDKFAQSIEFLHPKFVWDKPKLTVDGIIQIEKNGKWYIPLINRKFSPKGLAMPGGMIDSDDTNDALYTFKKEMEEELNLTNMTNIKLFNKFNAREPRGPVTTFVFSATSSQTPRAGDDAASFHWVEVGQNFEKLKPFLIKNKPKFAVNHHYQILMKFAQSNVTK